MGTSYNPKIVTDGLVLNLDPANVKSYPAGQDPFVNNVSLLLDGQSLTDKSQNNFTVTNSSAAINTAEFKYGNSSIYFNGSASLQISNSSKFNLGSSDFTIEAWIYPTIGSGAYAIIAKSQGNYTTGYEWWFGINNSPQNGVLQFTFVDASTTFYSVTNPNALSSNIWYHVAVSRVGSTIYLFVNGALVASTSAVTIRNTSSDVTIGRDLETTGGAGRFYTGYVDDVRITKGFGRFTSAFTPPTAPLSLPGVVTDLTKNKINSTLIAGPTHSSTNGGSLLFDGGTQYINIGSNSNLILGTNDFALELWFKPVSRAQLYPFLLHNEIGAGSAINCWQINDRHANNPTLATFWCYNYNAFSSSMLASTSAISNGNWYHLVITRIGNIFSMYLNSVLQSTVTSSISVDGGASMNYGFNTTGQGGFNGNSSIIKVYKGKGLTSTEVLQNYNATKGRFGL
jgi:hypothetical protein